MGCATNDQVVGAGDDFVFGVDADDAEGKIFGDQNVRSMANV